MAAYTEADFERAKEWSLRYSPCLPLVDASYVAQLIADVREEERGAERDRCLAIADDMRTGPKRMPAERAVAGKIAERIRGGKR
jgi:hypothetical protein